MGRTYARWVAVAAISSGCLFPSLSDLSGDDASTADATNEAAADVIAKDVGPTDVTNEAQPSDAGGFCATLDAANVVLCDDFDDSDASVFTSWTSSTGVLTRNPSVPKTPPFSLQATTPANLDANAPVVQARLLRSFTTPIAHVTQAFDARIDQADTLGSKAYLNMVVITSGGIQVQYRLAATSTTLIYEVHIPSGQDAASTSTSFALTPWALGTWHHVVVDITATDVPATVTVAIDGTTVVGPKASAPVAAFGAGQSIDIQAGIYYAATPESGWTVHADDVVVQAQ